MSAFDFGQAEAWDTSTGMLLPVGNFVVEFTKAEMGTTSTDKPQLELEVEDNQGRSRRDWIVITPNTTGKVVQVFDAAHVDRPQQGEFDPQTGVIGEAALARLRGAKAGVVIRNEPTLKDPTKEEPRIQGYVESSRITDEVPIDTRGLPAEQAASASRPAEESQSKIPF